MPWGIEVPGDPSQVMYVWFDALVNYISALGWPENKESFEEWWPGYQIAGKDNLRQQTAMWQAMLLSAGLPTSKQIFIEGFITSGGQKMSKSLGNVIKPMEYVEKYGREAVRYFLLAKIDPFEDSDMTRERFESSYQTDLANGLGNLVARVATMAEKSGGTFPVNKKSISEEVVNFLNEYKFDKAIEMVWEEVAAMDVLINEKEVWKLQGSEQVTVLTNLVERIRQMGVDLQPFMPETAKKIDEVFGKTRIERGENLFQRLKTV
jgi:methionyl-tRNA synthetase